MKDDLPYRIALYGASGIGTVRYRILLKHFKTASEVWSLSRKDLEKTLGNKLAEQFVSYRLKTNPEELFNKIKNSGIITIFDEDRDYPKLLKQIEGRPAMIFVKGELLPIDQKAVAVVGSRKVTSYGREVTESLVRDLVQVGLTIVSGMARGIDSIAHRAALDAGGRTIAVLGGGLNQIYPAENINLAKEIEKSGAVVSEYLPDVPSIPGNFPARNRIIAGLSLGVVVTEADEKSGSLITAGFAAEQGREVFAVPGPVYSRLTRGPASLIKDGAKLVMNASDVLEELKLDVGFRMSDIREIKGDTKEEQTIINLLGDGPAHIDDIVRRTGWETKKVSTLLSMLELKGKVRSVGNGSYSLVR